MNRKHLFLLILILPTLLFSCKKKLDRESINQFAEKAHSRILIEDSGDWWDPPGDIPEDATQATVDDWAWRLFIALNWPASTTERGVPDSSLGIGAPDTPVVWQTWKGPNEVFYPNGQQPAAWNEDGNPPLPSICTDAGAGKDGKAVIYMDAKGSGVPVADRTNQAVGYSLTAQNGQIVHYSITFSAEVFNYIYSGEYYNLTGQEKAADAGNGMDLPYGAMEMKASWVILDGSSALPDASRFYTTTSWVYTPATGEIQESCEVQTLGLIGLHFIRKVNVKGQPEWVWTTFEQVDNVPPFQTWQTPGMDPEHTWPYTLFNKDCYSGGCTYNQSIEDGRNPADPTQVIRVVDIGADAKEINGSMPAFFRMFYPDSPWQYYELVEAQWTFDPQLQPNGQPTPWSAANTTMETYLKAQDSSCINCHYTSKTKANMYGDSSFMFAQACPDPASFPWEGNWDYSTDCPAPTSGK